MDALASTVSGRLSGRSPERCLREPLDEEAPMQGIAPDLPQVGNEYRTPVVIHQYFGIVDYALAEFMGELEAEDGVLARPVTGVKPVYYSTYDGCGRYRYDCSNKHDKTELE